MIAQSSNQQRHFRPVKPGLSIVGDNAANYSQLLRSFSELSSDLVDLGQCIWLSGHRQPQTIGECCFNPTYGNCMGSYDHQQQTVSIRPSDVAASSSCWMQQPSGHGQLLDQAEADQLRLEMGADSLWLAEGRLEAKVSIKLADERRLQAPPSTADHEKHSEDKYSAVSRRS